MGRRTGHGVHHQRRPGRPAGGGGRAGGRVEPAPRRGAAVGGPRRGAVDPGEGVAGLAGGRRRRHARGSGRPERDLAGPGRSVRRPPRGLWRGAVPRCGPPSGSDGRGVDAAVVWEPALVDEAELVAAGLRHAGAGRRPGRGRRPRHDRRRARGRGRRRRQRGRGPAGAAGAPADRPRTRPRRWPRRSRPGSTAPRSGRRQGRPGRSPAGSTSGPGRSRSPRRPRLVVQLEPPDANGAWFLSVLGPGATGQLLPIEVALGDGGPARSLADELVRLERLLPVLHRPGPAAPRPGRPQPGRGLGADDGQRRRAGSGRLRRAGPRPLPAQAGTDAPALRRAGGGVPRRCASAQQRPLVGGVRRRRADRGRDHPPRHGGPSARAGPGPLGRARPGRPEGGGGRAGRALQEDAC